MISLPGRMIESGFVVMRWDEMRNLRWNEMRGFLSNVFHF
jgi:hypothetical protein